MEVSPPKVFEIKRVGMSNRPSISVIVPAYNEEKNLANTISAIKEAIDDRFTSYEIIIIDDDSSDKTASIADELSRREPDIKVFHNPKNMGFGYNYRMGVRLATKDYVALVPGDNEILGDSIKEIFNLVGSADMVLPYHANPEVRPLLRRVLSRTFTIVLNLLFGNKIKYYNGPVVHKREIVNRVPITTDGFAFQVEILTRLLKAGYTYVEVGMKIRKREYGHSKAFSLKNIFSVVKTVAKLYFWR